MQATTRFIPLLATCLLAAGGCSTFNADWQAAGRPLALADNAGHAAPLANPVLGRWEGHWRSEESGHTGGLRCIVTKPDDQLATDHTDSAAGDDTPIPSDSQLYEFRFQAVWGLNFKSEYTVHLRVTPQPAAQPAPGQVRYRVAGESDLGFPIGVYRGEGYIEGDTLQATYAAAGDEGVFEMARPTPDPAERSAP